MNLGASHLEPKCGGDGISEKWWVIPYVPVSANEMLRMHWTRRRQEKKTWLGWFGIAARRFGRAPWKARVSIQVRRGELQDPDNAVASVKPLLDALRARGWLYDDSGVHLELEVKEEVSSVHQTTVTWNVLQMERGR